MIERTASSGDTWRVGVLFSRSGLMAVTETEHFLGTALAIQEINQSGGILGREIEVVAYDPGSNPEITGCWRTGCSRKTGSPSSSDAAHRRPERRSCPRSSAATDCSGIPRSMRASSTPERHIYRASPNQNSFPLAEYLIRTYGKRIFFVGSDYVYPRESNRIMRDLIVSYGGEIAGEIYVPMEASDADLRAVLGKVKQQIRTSCSRRWSAARRETSIDSIARPASSRASCRSQA